MQFGSLHQTAPELRVTKWIDENGDDLKTPLKLSDLGDGYKIIYNFQHWCPGAIRVDFRPCASCTTF